MRAPTLGLLATLLTTPTLLAQPPEAAPSWLDDEAGALSDAGRARVTSLADEAWSRGQVRLAVTIVRDTGAATVAVRARESWRAQGLSGRAVLLYVAVDRRANHIEAGDAVEREFSESFRHWVLDEVFAPTARAQGVEAATVRTVEALHARALRPASLSQRVRENASALWRWLSDYGFLVLIGALAASGTARKRLDARRAVRRRAGEFDALSRSYRELRERFARPASGDGGYRDAPGVLTPGDDAELDELAARVAAARDGWGAPETRLAAVDASIVALRVRLDPLEAKAQAGPRFQSLREALPSALVALREELADETDYIKLGARAWPRESFDEARVARARAVAESEALGREVPESIARGEGLADDALLLVCEALDALKVRVHDAARDASEPRLRHEALAAAATDIEALRVELDYKSSEALGASRPGTPPAWVERHKARLEAAMSLRDKEMVPFAESLRALRDARRAILGQLPRSGGESTSSGRYSDSRDRSWFDSQGSGGSSGGSSGTSGSW